MTHLWRGTTGVAFLALWLSTGGSSLLLAGPDEDAEQLVIELVNRARHNPSLYAKVFNLSLPLQTVFDTIAAQPPVALNPNLTASAGFRALEMATFDYFDHQSAVTGKWPNRIAREHGYILPDFWELDNNYIESIAAGTTTPTQTINLLLIDEGIVPPGHRIHLLGMDTFFATHDEIGAGKAFDPDSTYGTYWAIHTALDNDPAKFVTGVVYSDGRVTADYSYTPGTPGTPGEGDAGILVEALMAGTTTVVGSTTTSVSGGYSLKLPAGTYDVRFRGDSSTPTVIHNGVVVGPNNAKVDSVSLWNQGGSGTFGWNLPGNWFGGVPNGVGTTAALVSSIPAARRVQANAITIGHLRLQNESGFTIEGAGANDLNFDVASGQATVSVIGTTPGQHTISAGVHINDDVTISVDQGGSLRFTGLLSNNGKTLTKLGAGRLDLDSQLEFANGSRLLAFDGTTNINFNSGTVNVNDRPLSIIVDNPGTQVNLNSSHYLDSLTIAGGKVTVTRGGNKVVALRSLNFEDPAMMIVPEPGAITLFGVGIVMVALVAFAGRRFATLRTK